MSYTIEYRQDIYKANNWGFFLISEVWSNNVRSWGKRARDLDLKYYVNEEILLENITKYASYIPWWSFQPSWLKYKTWYLDPELSYINCYTKLINKPKNNILENYNFRLVLNESFSFEFINLLFKNWFDFTKKDSYKQVIQEEIIEIYLTNKLYDEKNVNFDHNEKNKYIIFINLLKQFNLLENKLIFDISTYHEKVKIVYEINFEDEDLLIDMYKKIQWPSYIYITEKYNSTHKLYNHLKLEKDNSWYEEKIFDSKKYRDINDSITWRIQEIRNKYPNISQNNYSDDDKKEIQDILLETYYNNESLWQESLVNYIKLLDWQKVEIYYAEDKTYWWTVIPAYKEKWYLFISWKSMIWLKDRSNSRRWVQQDFKKILLIKTLQK